MNDDLKTNGNSIVAASAKAVKISPHEEALINEFARGEKKQYVHFVLAVLGSIPWVGSLLGAIAALDAEKDQGKVNDLQRLWVQEHQEKIQELQSTIQEILTRVDGFGDDVKQRIESPEYLQLVRKVFRAWDQVDTQEKRNMLKKLIINASAINLCPDDLIRLFTDWIARYHEAHFAVIKEIYKNPGITRGSIWDHIKPGERPRDDSSEAGLFAYLIRELSIGGVIHQDKAVNYRGEYMKSTRSSSRSSSSDTMESPFEETKSYVLTELGKQFVHYVMEDAVPQINAAAPKV